MSRGQIEHDKHTGKYTVIDSHYNTVAVQTTELRLAETVCALVNACKHDRPYDLLWHDTTHSELYSREQ